VNRFAFTGRLGYNGVEKRAARQSIGKKTMIKLLMSWDIKPGHEHAYFEFAVQELAPSMTKIGLHLTDAWYTVYGQGPQILVGGVTEDLESMQGILEGDEWQELREKLMKYVTNYSHKVVPAKSRFQM